MIKCVCGGVFYSCFPCVQVCVHVCLVPTEVWKPNSGPLGKQPLLLTPKPPLQFLFHFEVRIIIKGSRDLEVHEKNWLHKIFKSNHLILEIPEVMHVIVQNFFLSDYKILKYNLTSCLERVMGSFSSASSSSNTGFDDVSGFWSSSFGCI